MSKYHQVKDVYPRLKNPQKYKGTRPITTRSSWEYKFIMNYLDINNAVIEWGSESVVIPYVYELDGRTHRYYMDFNFKLNTGKEFLVEIKPFDQTQKPKRKGKNFEKRVATYVKNQNKWSATKVIVEQLRKKGREIEFKILTEKDLF